MSIPAPSLINEIDMELMLLIMRGYTSSYSLWNYAQENKTEYIKPVAYKNVNQRFLRLSRLGYIEEVKLGDNPHRRIDYKLTMKGLEQLIPYLLTHPNEVENIVKYMDKFNLDTETFSHSLFSKLDPMKRLVSNYESLTTADYAKESDSDWLSGKDLDQSETSFGIFSKNRQKALVDDLLNQIKEGLMEFDPDTLTLVRTKKGRKFVSVPMIKLTASLLDALHLAPTTMQLQKQWEAEEEEFKHEETVQSEGVNTSSNRYEELFKIIYENKVPSARYEAAMIIVKTFQEMSDSESNESKRKKLDRIINKINDILEQYKGSTSSKGKNEAMNEFYKIMTKDFKPELERMAIIINS